MRCLFFGGIILAELEFRFWSAYSGCRSQSGLKARCADFLAGVEVEAQSLQFGGSRCVL